MTIKLSYETSGTGVPLVFVHAFPLSRKMWEPNKSALNRNFQFVTVDLPGFGDSPLEGSTSTMENMAQNVLEILNEINITKPAVFIGVSMGGYVLFQILKLFPQRIRALVLVSTRAAADTTEARDRRYKTIESIEKEGNLKNLALKMIPNLFGKSSLQPELSIVSEIRKQIENSNPQAVCAALRGMAERPDSTPFLSTIGVPTLVVSGQEDNFIPAEEMKLLADKVKNVEFHVLPRAGHLLNLERPEVFNELVLRFLKRRVL
jgi:pimeloyl-ACP methyl ester carboxylesterase